MSRPICVKCHREMFPKENEFLVRDEYKGGFEPTFWYGDLYECPGCKVQIVTGFGKGLLLEQMSSKDTARAMVFRR